MDYSYNKRLLIIPGGSKQKEELIKSMLDDQDAIDKYMKLSDNDEEEKKDV